MSNLPTVLKEALDADAAYKACNREAHPRISARLWNTAQAKLSVLSHVYPQITDWLFGCSYRNQAERIEELKRLLAEEPNP